MKCPLKDEVVSKICFNQYAGFKAMWKYGSWQLKRNDREMFTESCCRTKCTARIIRWNIQFKTKFERICAVRCNIKVDFLGNVLWHLFLPKKIQLPGSEPTGWIWCFPIQSTALQLMYSAVCREWFLDRSFQDLLLCRLLEYIAT